MKVLAALLVATSLVSVANAAVASCEDTCVIPLEMGCEDAIAKYEFSGSCCSLSGWKCKLMTTSDCYIQEKGATGCTTDEQGNEACVIPGTAYTSFSNDPCPDSEFEVPMMATGDETTEESSPVATGSNDTAAPATDAPSAAAVPGIMMSFAAFAVLQILEPTWAMVEGVILEI